MGFLVDSLRRAVELTLSMDPELVRIVVLSLRVSGTAILLASITGITLGIILYRMHSGPLKRVLVVLVNTSMGLPPVVVGLGLYLILSRSGPLGWLNILYTPTAMVLAQYILATPIVAGIVHSTLASSDPNIRFTAYCLGATEFQATMRQLKEARYAIVGAVVAGLGRIVAEVGAVLIVGGNIAGYTRVMTTAIALEADRGDFILAIALGIILLALALMVNICMYLLQQKAEIR